jgi:hypothetical protein
MKSGTVLAALAAPVVAVGPGDWRAKPQGQRIIPRLDQSPYVPLDLDLHKKKF